MMSADAPMASLADDFSPATREAWQSLVAKVLRGADPERRLVARTSDGLRIEALYTRDRAAADAPILRAELQSAIIGWDVRQRHGSASAEATNATILQDLAAGVTSITLRIAAPGQAGLGYQSADLARALDGVDLAKTAIALDAGEYTPDTAGSLMALWRQRGLASATARGNFGYDPLGTLARTGALYNSVPRSLGAAASLLAATREMPAVLALLADGRPYHAAGASEAQELAAMLATLVAYLRSAEAAGMAPSDAWPHIAVALAADADQLMTMAKLRAARRLVHRIGQASGASGVTHLTAETATRMMARRDPWTNILRSTIATAAAAMGGADAITVLPFTHALGEPDAFARRIARNTQLVLARESGLGRVVDPARGSFALESLTTALAAKAWELFQAIETKGGMGEALVSGRLQDEIARAAELRRRDAATLRAEITGVNAFPLLADDGVTADPHEPPLPAELNGARAKPLAAIRLAAPFEWLRDKADAYAKRTGTRPCVYLATLGDLAAHGARATWMKNFLAAGGIEAVVGEGAHDTPSLGRLYGAAALPIACLCGNDASYGELGEAAAGILKAAGARKVLLAGRPGTLEAGLKAAGVDQFIFAGGDALAVLEGLHVDLGV